METRNGGGNDNRAGATRHTYRDRHLYARHIEPHNLISYNHSSRKRDNIISIVSDQISLVYHVIISQEQGDSRSTVADKTGSKIIHHPHRRQHTFLCKSYIPRLIEGKGSAIPRPGGGRNLTRWQHNSPKKVRKKTLSYLQRSDSHKKTAVIRGQKRKGRK